MKLMSHCEEAAKGAQIKQNHKFLFLIVYTLLMRLEKKKWKNPLFFCIYYFFMFIALQASEILVKVFTWQYYSVSLEISYTSQY